MSWVVMLLWWEVAQLTMRALTGNSSIGCVVGGLVYLEAWYIKLPSTSDRGQ